MPRLYNPARVPFPVTLKDGSVTSIPGKGTLSVPEEQMGSSDIARALKGRQLLRRGENPVKVSASVPTPVPAPVIPVVPVVPEVTSAPAPSSPLEASDDKSSKKSKRP